MESRPRMETGLPCSQAPGHTAGLMMFIKKMKLVKEDKWEPAKLPAIVRLYERTSFYFLSSAVTGSIYMVIYTINE